MTNGAKDIATRPRVTVRRWAWRYPDKTELPGIGFFRHNDHLQAHLTPDQARAMADKLHDLADQLEKETS